MNEQRPADRPPGDRKGGPPGGPTSSGEVGTHEEPVAAGTLFIMLLFLMALAGMWGLMYLILINR